MAGATTATNGAAAPPAIAAGGSREMIPVLRRAYDGDADPTRTDNRAVGLLGR